MLVLTQLYGNDLSALNNMNNFVQFREEIGMYYMLEWSEKGINRFKRVYHAKDVPVLWRAVKYMNMERKERKLPIMEKIEITELNNYDGEFSKIVGSYTKDLQLDDYLANTQ